MDLDRSKWDAAEWQAFALTMEKAHQSALDGWGVTVSELEAHAELVSVLRESIEISRKHIELLECVPALLPAPAQVKRGRGRPKKHGEFNVASWYESECLPKYREQNHGTPPGMQKVLTWYFREYFRKEGLNPLRVDQREYQRKLKTMVNLISDQRHPPRARHLPENSAFFRDK